MCIGIPIEVGLKPKAVYLSILRYFIIPEEFILTWDLKVLRSLKQLGKYLNFVSTFSVQDQCLSCHMPEGRHTFLGVHNVDFVQAALSLNVQKMPQGYEFTLRPQGVGHHLPTGDLFRHLTLEVASLSGDDFKVVKRFGRRYTPRW